jgi:actin-like ATPase involved in cell morphogenesis
MPIHLAQNPLHAVAIGSGQYLEAYDTLRHLYSGQGD